MELPKAYGITDGAFLRLDSIQRFALIPYCLLTDSIHGFAVIKLGLNQGSVCAFLDLDYHNEIYAFVRLLLPLI
jgi:hypothetical protein